MHSDNRTKYGAVRYVTVGGFDRDNPEHMAEVHKIADLIEDAPALLDALEDLYASISGGNKSCGHDFECVCATDKARALIAKHRGKS